MKILLAADGSAYTQHILDYLARHTVWMDPQHAYTVLHAIAPVPALAASMLDHGALKHHYDEEAQRVFAPLKPFFERNGLQADYVCRIGHAAEVIAETAVNGRHDLAVMGSHGHGAFSKLVMGSVSTKVLAHCSTPVLLVR